MGFNMKQPHRLLLVNKQLPTWRLNRLGQQLLFIIWLTQCGNKAQEHQQQHHLHQNAGVGLVGAGGEEQHQVHYPVDVNVIKANLRLQLQWSTNQDDINRTSGSTSSSTSSGSISSWFSLPGSGNGSETATANVDGNNGIVANSSLPNDDTNAYVKSINNTLSLNQQNATSAVRNRLQDLNHKADKDKIQHDNKDEADKEDGIGEESKAIHGPLMHLNVSTPQNLQILSTTTLGYSQRQVDKSLVSLQHTTITINQSLPKSNKDNASNTRIASNNFKETIINPSEDTTTKTKNFENVAKHKDEHEQVTASASKMSPREISPQISDFLPTQQKRPSAVNLAMNSNARTNNIATSATKGATKMFALPGKSGSVTKMTQQGHQPQTVRMNKFEKEAEGKLKPLSSSNSSMFQLLNNNLTNENGTKVENQPGLAINKGLFLKSPKDLHNKQLNVENEKLIEDLKQPGNNNNKIFAFIITKQQRKDDNTARLSQEKATFGYRSLKTALLNNNMKLQRLHSSSQNMKDEGRTSNINVKDNNSPSTRPNLLKLSVEKPAKMFDTSLSGKILGNPMCSNASSSNSIVKSDDAKMSNELTLRKASENLSKAESLQSLGLIVKPSNNKSIQAPDIQTNIIRSESFTQKANSFAPIISPVNRFTKLLKELHSTKLTKFPNAFGTHAKDKKILEPKLPKFLPEINPIYLKLARKLDTKKALDIPEAGKYISLEKTEHLKESTALPDNVNQIFFQETQLEVPSKNRKLFGTPKTGNNLKSLQEDALILSPNNQTVLRNKTEHITSLKESEHSTQDLKEYVSSRNKVKEMSSKISNTFNSTASSDVHEFNESRFQRNKRLQKKNFQETTGTTPPPTTLLNISIISNVNSSTNSIHAMDKHHNSVAINETKANVISISKSEAINKSEMREKHQTDEGNFTNVLQSKSNQGYQHHQQQQAHWQKGYLNNTLLTPDYQNETAANITLHRMDSNEMNVMNSKRLDGNLLKDMDNKWLKGNEFQNADEDKGNNGNDYAETNRKNKSPAIKNVSIRNNNKENVLSTTSPVTALATSSATTTLATAGIPTTDGDVIVTETPELWEFPTTLRATAATEGTTLPAYTGITIEPQEIYNATTSHTQDYGKTTNHEQLQEIITSSPFDTISNTTTISSANISLSPLPDSIISSSMRTPIMSTTSSLLSSLSSIQDFVNTRLTTTNSITIKPMYTSSLMQLPTSTLSSMLPSSAGFPSTYSPLTSVSTSSSSSPYSYFTGSFYTTTTTTTSSTPLWPVKHASVMEGNVILGGLMMVHSREDSITCGPIMPQGGIQALEAMLYTLDQVNKQQLLPNITLGAHILDDCDKDTYGLEMAVDFIKGE